MNYPTICADNFLENPEEIVEYSKKLKFFKSEDGRWPGERTPLNQDPVNIFLLQKISTLIHPYKTPKFRIYADSHFQKINNQYGDIGWIHRDLGTELTAIIYLSKNKNSGTSLYKPKSFENFTKHGLVKENFYKTLKKSKHYEKCLKENNDQFEETVYFESIYNRIIVFNGNQYHGVKNFDNDKSDRLTFITFIKFLSDDDLRNGLLESRKVITLLE